MPQMQLTVHIGTTKTGSTSIQKFLSTNREELQARGLCVPTSLGEVDHRKAAVSSLVYGQSIDLLERLNLNDRQSLETFRTETQQAFQAELCNNKCEHVVITSEHLQSRCNRPENVALFRDLFAKSFTDARIVIYVRPQLDQLVSLYSTTLRNGFSETMAQHIDRHMRRAVSPYFDLKDVITRWSALFGDANVLVRPYKALPPAQGGVVADFCQILGFRHDDPAFSTPTDVNSSISTQGQELLRILNQGGGLEPAQKRKVVAWVEQNCSGKGEQPKLAQAQSFQAQFREGNDWVVQKYFPDHPEYLEPRWPQG